ncbi:MAG: twin-arginine translocation signal domain-containing protein, partial [Planctomycetota bacterium]
MMTVGNCMRTHCPLGMNRRGFLAASGAAALAAPLQVFDFASTLLASEVPQRHTGPLVSVGFALREQGGRWWPAGTTKMLKDIRAQYEKILSDAADELGVRLDIMPELMKDGSAYVERIKKTSP